MKKIMVNIQKNPTLYRMNIVHYADILAIPCFFILIVYLYKKNRTRTENFLFLFAIAGFVLDTVFTIFYLMT